MRTDAVIKADFSSVRSRRGPLTLGQANILRSVELDDPTHLTAGLVWAVPPGSTPRQVAELIGQLLRRHESLRTTYHLDHDPIQVVAGSGALTIGVYESDGDSAGLAERLARHMRSLRFDLPNEFQLRAAVVTVDDVCVHAVFAVGHLAVDGQGLEILAKEWDALVTGHALPEPSSFAPVDQTQIEHGEAGRRRAKASLRYWEARLGQIPQAMFALPGVGDSDWQLPRLRVRSSVAADAVDKICRRTRSSRAVVVLAAMAALTAHRVVQDKCVIALISANRFEPRLRDYVGTIAQDALMYTMVDAATLDEVVHRVRDASFAAYQNSQFDAAELWKTIHGVGARRGTSFARDVVFNDVSALTLDNASAIGLDAPSTVDPETVNPTGDIRLTWSGRAAMPARLVLWAYQLVDDIDLSLWMDPHALSKTEAETFACGLMTLLINAADRDVPMSELGSLTSVQAVSRGAGWYLIDSCWVELAAVRRMLSDVLGDKLFHLAVTPDPTLGHRLTCYVAVADDLLSVSDLHGECMAALAGRISAMAPHEYVICESAPVALDQTEAWRGQPIVEASSGRTGPS